MKKITAVAPSREPAKRPARLAKLARRPTTPSG
jgi:hypothetical protein